MHKEGLFAFFEGATISRYKKLVEYFGSLDEAWIAPETALRKTRCSATFIAQFLRWKHQLNEQKIIDLLEQKHIRAIAITEPDYPKLLRQIYDPPFCLFVRGTLSDQVCVAVVGPRKKSDYAEVVTNMFVRELLEYGICIVSGLAMGIDSIAHKQSIAQQGKTWAVLPGGVDSYSIVPATHRSLAEQITEHGALISEHIPQAPIYSYSFPQRNRIISGLSHATLVIEGSHTSGALITAKYALEQGREVCAVPQNITSPTSTGVNGLIASGAHLVQSAEDIINILGLSKNNRIEKEQQQPQNDTEQKIYSTLDYTIPKHIDELLRELSYSRQEILATLPIMELKQLIRNTGGMYYLKQ